MNRSIESTGYVLFLFLCFLVALNGFRPLASDSEIATLGVPLVPQRGACLCWAACSEMVTRYLHGRDSSAPVVSECYAVVRLSQLTGRSGPTDSLGCPPLTIPWDTLPQKYGQGWDMLGNPQMLLDSCGYSITAYMPNDSLGTHADTLHVIPVSRLREELLAHRPVISNWNIEGTYQRSGVTNTWSGAHFIVIEGLQHSALQRGVYWVAINDPDPVMQGHHRLARYKLFTNAIPNEEQQGNGITVGTYDSTFVTGQHGTDYINIQYVKGATK